MIKKILYVISLMLISLNSFTQNHKNLSDNQKDRYQFLLSKAVIEMILENYDESITTFMTVIEVDDKSPIANYYLAKIYSKRQKFQTALSFAENSVKYNENNFWYKMQYAELLSITDKSKEAVNILNELIVKFPNEEPAYKLLAHEYFKCGNEKKYLKTLDKYEETFSFPKDMYEKLYNKQVKEKKYTEAEKTLNRIINKNPDDVKYKAVLAELYLATNQVEKSDELYNKLLAEYPENNEVILSYLNYCLYYKERNDFISLSEKVFKSYDVSINVKLELLNNKVFKLTDEENENLLNILVETHPDNSDIKLMQANFLLSKNNIEDANQVLEQAFELDKNNSEIIKLLIQTDFILKKYESLYSNTKQFLELYPNNPNLYYYNGLAAIIIGKHKEALEVLEMGLDLVLYEPQYLSNFYYQIAIAYFLDNNKKKCIKYFEMSLKENPENYDAMSEYAYILGNYNENIKKAEEYAEKSYEKDNTNESYIKNYAYILLKNNKLYESKTIIEKHISKSDNPDLYEIMGDIYIKKENKAEAIKYWKKALNNSRNKKRIEEKIQSAEK